MNPLLRSVVQNDLMALKDNLERGLSPNARGLDGRTPLMHATIECRSAAATMLLAAGADVNAKDDTGYTALHFAAQGSADELARLLIASGAAVDSEDVYGNTPLWVAVFNSQGRGEVIKTLLHAGANKQRRNRAGVSPVELAATIANFDILRFFGTDRGGRGG